MLPSPAPWPWPLRGYSKLPGRLAAPRSRTHDRANPTQPTTHCSGEKPRSPTCVCARASTLPATQPGRSPPWPAIAEDRSSSRTTILTSPSFKPLSDHIPRPSLRSVAANTDVCFRAILANGFVTQADGGVVLAGVPAALPQLRRRADLSIVAAHASALPNVPLTASAWRGGLRGRVVHVQHRGGRAHLCRSVSPGATGHLAHTALEHPAVRRHGDDGDRTVALLSFFQNHLPGLRPDLPAGHAPGAGDR